MSPWNCIVDDHPVESDHCWNDGRVEEVSRYIQEWSARTPDKFKTSLVIGLNGPWGSGKTSFALQVREDLKTNPSAEYEWFEVSGWKFPDRNSFWRAIVLQILNRVRGLAGHVDANGKKITDVFALSGLSEDEQREYLTEETAKMCFKDFLANISTSMYMATQQTVSTGGRINWGNILFSLLGAGYNLPLLKEITGGLHQGVNEIIGEERQEKTAAHAGYYERLYADVQFAEIRSLDQFSRLFLLLTRILCNLPKDQDKKRRRLLFCIDDLDRCMPDTSVEILETLKAFMDSPYCCYLVPLDPNIIETGLDLRYKGDLAGGRRAVDCRDYLDKIFNYSRSIDALTLQQVRRLISAIAGKELTGEAEEAVTALAAIAPFPRKIKHLIALAGGSEKVVRSDLEAIRVICRRGMELEWGARYPELLLNPAAANMIQENRGNASCTESMQAIGIGNDRWDIILRDKDLLRFLDRIEKLKYFDNIAKYLTG